MSRVITFSRTFQGNHPKAGIETFFREKIWCGLADRQPGFKIPNEITDWDWFEYYNGHPKGHTIRAGHRFKVEDWFSPRVWSGRPYQSRQIIIAPDLQIKKIWDFDIDLLTGDYLLGGFHVSIDTLKIIARNDGFEELDDFECWFPREFRGQIICWDEKINYSI